MKKFSLYLMVALYVLAGANHFYNPDFYEVIMPKYIGYHKLLIYVSGACEIVLALLLIPQYTRKIASILIIIMLIIFLWLHIQMLIDYWKNNDRYLWIAILRIPLQFVLIWWGYTFTRSRSSKEIK
ncbi:MAG TPA: MauE/DoxX family redox-associated membrane protein [Bacteroidia bacterium]|nr:MauE/DoxX family redox-associated membrane protein [Bacteroidia bacterium]